MAKPRKIWTMTFCCLLGSQKSVQTWSNEEEWAFEHLHVCAGKCVCWSVCLGSTWGWNSTSNKLAVNSSSSSSSCSLTFESLSHSSSFNFNSCRREHMRKWTYLCRGEDSPYTLLYLVQSHSNGLSIQVQHSLIASCIAFFLRTQKIMNFIFESLGFATKLWFFFPTTLDSVVHRCCNHGWLNTWITKMNKWNS